ncbi:hypothetical protein C7974DRAFT_386025 [Boeremia exigua]|uniref:uncharacterized protein n=1 Tax=Boeremia exigua TaxID=749465 RepID=UPI001E8E586E|nr:uncharacterized protein C7974DRAFT_386025 [Boeremia exigua]KAH6642734.1 hypothetical protein C7974DRAFT_386025 [Boeremia exigua]
MQQLSAFVSQANIPILAHILSPRIRKLRGFHEHSVRETSFLLTSTTMYLQLVLLASYPLVVAQGSLQPSDCIGDISNFPNCDSVNTILDRCNQTTDKEATVNCMCTQDFIDSWIGYA